MKFIGGLQIIILFIGGAIGFKDLTGAGPLASFVFGGMGLVMIVALLFIWLPRIMIAVGAVLWTIAGYSLAHWAFGDVLSALAGAIVVGGMGAGANYLFMQETLQDYMKGQQFGERMLPSRPKSSASATSTQVDIILKAYKSIHTLDSIGVLEENIFARLDQKCNEVIDSSGVDIMHPDAQVPQHVDEVEAFDSLSHLKGVELVSKSEAEEIRAKIALWSKRAVAPAVTSGSAPIATPTAVAPSPAFVQMKEPLSEDDMQFLAGSLYRLVYNRAMSLDTFRRLMKRLDPSVDHSGAKEDNFPFEDEGDNGDLEIAQQLYGLKLIDLAEYRRTLQVILPYIHEKNAGK